MYYREESAYIDEQRLLIINIEKISIISITSEWARVQYNNNVKINTAVTGVKITDGAATDKKYRSI